MAEGVTLPAPLGAGTDWNATLQSIAAYGAGRYFDSKAVENIYNSNPTPVNTDAFNNFFQAGTKAPNGEVNNAPLGIPLIVWLIGGGLAAFFVLKD